METAKLFYGYYEDVDFDGVTKVMKAFQRSMAIEVKSSMRGGYYSVSVYGTFGGDAEYWGLSDADDTLYQGFDRFESTKKLYETMKANGEF